MALQSQLRRLATDLRSVSTVVYYGTMQSRWQHMQRNKQMEQKPTRKFTQYSCGSLELLATPVTITAYQGGGS